MGYRVNELGTSVYPWYVTATIRSGTGNPSAKLLGNTTIKFVNGWANFTNLGISYMGTGYIIDFNVTSPTEGENMTLASDPIDISARPIIAVAVSSTSNVYEASFMSVGLELRDSVTGETISDIAWRGHTWNVDATIGKPALYNGTLNGATSAMFDTVSSQANFHSLSLTMIGMTVIKFHVTSIPPDYDFYVEHLVPVKGKHHIGMVPEETSEIILRINADYNTIVGTEDKYVSAMFGNWFANNFPEIRFDSASVKAGSIMVTLTVSGSHTDINSTLYSTCSLISNGQSFSYNGATLTLSGYMTYNGHSFYGVSCNVSPDNEKSLESSVLPVHIIAGVSVGVSVLCVVVVLVIWKCKIIAKTKVHDLYQDKKDIDDILFREGSFVSIKAPVATLMYKTYRQKY